MSIPFEDSIASPSALRFEAEQLDIYGSGTKMSRLHSITGTGRRITANVTEHQHSRLKKEALRLECSMAAITREALAEWLELHGRPWR